LVSSSEWVLSLFWSSWILPSGEFGAYFNQNGRQESLQGRPDYPLGSLKQLWSVSVSVSTAGWDISWEELWLQTKCCWYSCHSTTLLYHWEFFFLTFLLASAFRFKESKEHYAGRNIIVLVFYLFIFFKHSLFQLTRNVTTCNNSPHLILYNRD